MKTVMIIIIFFECCLLQIDGLKNLTGTPEAQCINCLCHARTGCWRRQNCASYSITRQYWEQAGSPTIDINDNPDDINSYTKCMVHENCILNTIYGYVKSFGNLDCNCDTVVDCVDWFAVHLNGNNCYNQQYDNNFVNRFNSCRHQVNAAHMNVVDNCKVMAE